MVALLKTLSHLKPCNVLVLGDFLLDMYTTGQVKRISPEAPVPVMEVHAQEMRPGGAGNVVMSLQAKWVPGEFGYSSSAQVGPFKLTAGTMHSSSKPGAPKFTATAAGLRLKEEFTSMPAAQLAAETAARSGFTKALQVLGVNMSEPVPAPKSVSAKPRGRGGR